MSERRAKKIRREVSRNVDRRMRAEFLLITKMLRPKPRYLPRLLWKLMARAFFTKPYIAGIVGKKK